MAAAGAVDLATAIATLRTVEVVVATADATTMARAAPVTTTAAMEDPAVMTMAHEALTVMLPTAATVAVRVAARAAERADVKADARADVMIVAAVAAVAVTMTGLLPQLLVPAATAMPLLRARRTAVEDARTRVTTIALTASSPTDPARTQTILS